MGKDGSDITLDCFDPDMNAGVYPETERDRMRRFEIIQSGRTGRVFAHLYLKSISFV